jgi:hypothetical protein
MTGMVDDSVASHGGHDLETVRDRLGGKRPRVIGRLGPGSLDVEAASENPDYGAMASSGELGGGWVCDQEQSWHWRCRVPS